MSQGYGGGAGAPLPPEPIAAPADRLLAAIEDLDRKVAANGYEKWVPVTLPLVNNTAFITTEENPVTMCTIQVFAGEVVGVFSDQQGQPIPPVPYFDLAVVGVPVHIPLTTKARELTLWAKVAPATASVWLHSPSH